MTTHLAELSREECVELLIHRAHVGRLAFQTGGRLMLLPVNYLAREDSVVFCTAPGTKLSALAEGAEVVFEVDANSIHHDGGWSVVVRGIAKEITDSQELEHVRRRPLHSWAAPSPEHYVRISIDEITGRRITQSPAPS